ncbi:hypothetical protein F1880_003612 [Penicillium rolfsii]|nr:hypothetical protein F1880_003612 [Penicillium rolfsii]
MSGSRSTCSRTTITSIISIVIVIDINSNLMHFYLLTDSNGHPPSIDRPVVPVQSTNFPPESQCNWHALPSRNSVGEITMLRR